MFLIVIYTEVLSIEDADKQQSKLFKELSDINKSEKPFENKSFLKNAAFLLDARENFLIVSKVIYFH